MIPSTEIEKISWAYSIIGAIMILDLAILNVRLW